MVTSWSPLLQAGQHLLPPDIFDDDLEAHLFLNNITIRFNVELSEIKLIVGIDGGKYAALVRLVKDSPTSPRPIVEVLIKTAAFRATRKEKGERIAVRALAADIRLEVEAMVEQAEKQARKSCGQEGTESGAQELSVSVDEGAPVESGGPVESDSLFVSE